MNRALATAFGLVMVAASAVNADDQALVAAGLAAAAVLLGIAVRPVATIAVLLTAAVIVIDDAPPMLAALAGLSAAGYLVLRHTAGTSGPTLIGAVGFAAAALLAVSMPWQLPWLPLVAPIAVLALIVLVTRPFWA
ncbi:hypothetical protein [Mycobacterium deserti]|uniref:Integral membrane protein n=1 Tax=Mycobacterium deserti TaxID=2978347 RepID=A0ABT2MGL8_9MYCO|nr:hypothetical protein [Mycobacterium deserti]MCT7661439.1 hypothetical protein [Mycobacterium deserti]